jgi:hypothetical protein
MKKITMATLKSFINKNKAALFINVLSEFDGMTDGCESRDGGFQKIEVKTFEPHTLGIKGLWLVGSSRDNFYE